MLLIILSTVPVLAVPQDEYSTVEVEPVEIGAAIGPPPPKPEGYDEKVAWADQYVQAKLSGNYALAANLLRQSAQTSISQRGYSANAYDILQADNALNIARATSKILMSMYQRPQETDSWCGFSALESVIEETGRNTTQTQIVKDITNSSYASPSASLAWYSNDGSDASQYPASMYLNSLQMGFAWAPYPIGQAGANPATATQLSSNIISTIDHGWGCMALIQATDGSEWHDSYPVGFVGHWLGIRGYSSSGGIIKIVDPANSVHVGWAEKPPSYYDVSNTHLADYVADRGIIW